MSLRTLLRPEDQGPPSVVPTLAYTGDTEVTAAWVNSFGCDGVYALLAGCQDFIHRETKSYRQSKMHVHQLVCFEHLCGWLCVCALLRCVIQLTQKVENTYVVYQT